MRSQRWEWTHTYGVHLFVASVIAVLLSGSGLVTVVALGGGGEDPDQPRPLGPPPPQSGPTPSAVPQTSESPEPTEPTPTGTPAGELDRECVVGTWTVVALEDIGFTGTWTLIGGAPSYEFGTGGTGAIDYGEGGADATTFEFEDFLGGTANSFPTGRREFEFSVGDGEIEFTYLDVLGGARMHGIPYSPGEDTFQARCGDGTMTMSGNKGYVELERRDS